MTNLKVLFWPFRYMFNNNVIMCMCVCVRELMILEDFVVRFKIGIRHGFVVDVQPINSDLYVTMYSASSQSSPRVVSPSRVSDIRQKSSFSFHR